MFKKTLGFVAVAAAFAGLGLVSTTTANAAAANSDDVTGNTTAQVSLTNDDTAGLGGIKLTAVPNIVFDSTALTGAATSAALKSMDSDLTVTNPGIDSATGWTVQLKSEPMTNAEGNTLTGGSYTLDGTASVEKTTDDTNATTALTSSTTINTGNTESQNIMTAAAHQGIGIWSAGLNSDTTKPTLTIPSQAVKGDYSQNLTWTLANTPA
ncbi:WxL domain-containing protein [Levilactobacillus cerevisiae]|uniref:WxL domain-containing protein n=1 Tax=Levilactobacillus cerevisiae TaxID=1704076 RepID=UPI000F78F463|nr:WxL domain-containing protein [Levilactobacillus cerevisiae]